MSAGGARLGFYVCATIDLKGGRSASAGARHGPEIKGSASAEVDAVGPFRGSSAPATPPIRKSILLRRIRPLTELLLGFQN